MKNIAMAIMGFASLSLFAQGNEPALRVEALRAAKQQARASGRIAPNFSSSCATKSLPLPATVNATLTSAACFDPVISVYEDVYAINGISGQTLRIDYSSTQFDVFLWLETNGAPLVLPTRASFLDANNHGTSRETMTYTFSQTKTYYIEAEALYSPGSSRPTTGSYTLLASTTTCSDTATTLCLNGGRFAVSVAWKDFNNNTGNGRTVPLTNDTGAFWFFGSQNYELMLKVLDARTLNNRFWVFFGALSTVEYTITVKDTVTNRTKTYFNKSGNLGSVADTDAFTP
jgi:hypothetical protein